MIQLTVQWSFVDTIDTDVLLHLFDLKKHKARVWISVSMVLNEEGQSLVGSSIGDEPSGTFGDKPNGEHDNYTGESLEDQGDSPCPVTGDEFRAVHYGSRGDRPTKPSAVIEP